MAKLKIEEILKAIRKGAGTGFVLLILVLFIMILYAFISGYDVISFISREGIMIPTLYQMGLWIGLYMGTLILERFIADISGEEKPVVEGSPSTLRGMLGILSFIYLVMTYLAITSIKTFEFWEVLLYSPIIVSFLFTAVEIWRLNRLIT